MNYFPFELINGIFNLLFSDLFILLILALKALNMQHKQMLFCSKKAQLLL